MRSSVRRSGQTSSEHMLVISVIVVAAVAAAYTFLPDFQSGVASLGSDVSSILATHQMAGVGGSGAGSGSGPQVAAAEGDTVKAPPVGYDGTGADAGSGLDAG